MTQKLIVMLGTDFRTMGGVASVVNVYRDAGLFQRFPIRYLSTHCDGCVIAKLKVMLSAWFQFMFMPAKSEVGLVHCHTASRASFWRKTFFLIPAFLAGVPAVLHLHGAEFKLFYENECGGGRRRFIRWVFDHCRLVVALSAGWKDWVESIGITAPVVAIYNPVELAQPSQWRNRQRGNLLFLGRLGQRKGVYDLLSAVSQLPDRVSGNVHLQMGGNGELDEVRKRAESLQIADKVQLLGWIGKAERQALFASSWAYCLPSYNEGLPMSMLEAMAAGLPVISTPVGGIPEAITDGVEGFLVSPGDTGRLAECIARLIADEALARRMGATARSKVELCFSTAAVLPQVELIYRRFGFSEALESRSEPIRHS